MSSLPEENSDTDAYLRKGKTLEDSTAKLDDLRRQQADLAKRVQEAEAKKQEATEELSKAKSRVVALTDKMDTDDDKEAVDVDAKKRPVVRVLMEVASVMGPRFTCNLPFSRLSCSTNSGLLRRSLDTRRVAWPIARA